MFLILRLNLKKNFNILTCFFNKDIQNINSLITEFKFGYKNYKNILK